jgi:cell division protein FtsL
VYRKIVKQKRRKASVRKKNTTLTHIAGSWGFLLVIAFLILTIWPILHLYLMNEIKETQYKVDAIRNNITRIQQSIIDIDSEIARLSRADRITYIARHQLNMVITDPGIDVVVIE